MSQLFKRKVEVILPRFKLLSDNLTIEFDIPFDNDIEPNEAEITVYNLSTNTRNNIKKNDKIIVNAGYNGDIGTVLEGRVSHIETDYTGADRATRIYVLDSEDLEGKKTINKSYKANTKASMIVNDLLPQLGLPIARTDFPLNPTYAEGYTAEGDLKEVLSDLASDCGVSFYIHRGKVYFHYVTGSQGDDVFVLNADSGLIGIPEPFESDYHSGYKARCLLNHRVRVATTIDLQSKYAKGKFKVLKGSHECNSDDFVTEMELIR